MAWLTVNTSDVIYHKAWLQSAPSTRFQEIGGQAIDGTVYHAMEMVGSILRTYTTRYSLWELAHL